MSLIFFCKPSVISIIAWLQLLPSSSVHPRNSLYCFLNLNNINYRIVDVWRVEVVVVVNFLPSIARSFFRELVVNTNDNLYTAHFRKLIQLQPRP